MISALTHSIFKQLNHDESANTRNTQNKGSKQQSGKIIPESKKSPKKGQQQASQQHKGSKRGQ